MPKSSSFTHSFFSRNRELVFSLAGGLFLLAGYLLERADLFGWAVALYLLSFAVGGYFKAKEGLTDLVKDRSLNVEVLMIVAAAGAASIGYWSEGAILIFIFSLAGAMETYTLEKSERDLSNLIRMAPEKASLLLPDGETKVVNVESLEVGNRILVRPGERIPADGTVITGESTTDEAAITGESMPVDKKSGSSVYNGTINGTGSLTVKVTKRNADSLFQKMIALVRQAKTDRPPSQQLIEKIEGPYVITVLLTVAVMLTIPVLVFGFPFEETFYRAMVLLVVASPCAVVASVMPALLSAISTGARNGILIKGGVYLEQLAKTGVIAFDKTGTLTEGSPAVTGFQALPGNDEEAVLAAAAAIERQSDHPLAHAIAAYAGERSRNLPAVETIEDVPGYGVRAVIAGETWHIGRSGFAGDTQAWEPVRNVTGKWAEEGNTLVYAAKNGEPAGFFALKDQIRPAASAALNTLADAGIETVMITGDREATARKIAKEAGVSRYVAECLPEEKVREVERLRKDYGAVVMVGDGVNDAPALAKADTGIAMGSGTGVAIDTAHIVLMNSELEKIELSLELSRRLNRIVKQNLIFSVAVIAVLITANFAQSLTLPLGVIGHEGSTILVILNGLRLLRVKQRKGGPAEPGTRERLKEAEVS
ncbi:heavy metal translocating P-type ATPase [Alteribacter lacisalsi]|uniref:Heavy metal translocating P-type ATPase n=1 Tax=Alteribacter lacisalsi TaxID=2045244 RepID=A0A2W0H2V1_9BACI|nr:heavy metal translocating P-type ATPase [Alteribacter lacisalsi]PYZ96124.1 heavy metal translocating P-type ATPase [Alteribacter lacisalsi]